MNDPARPLLQPHHLTLKGLSPSRSLSLALHLPALQLSIRPFEQFRQPSCPLCRCTFRLPWLPVPPRSFSHRQTFPTGPIVRKKFCSSLRLKDSIARDHHSRFSSQTASVCPRHVDCRRLRVGGLPAVLRTSQPAIYKPGPKFSCNFDRKERFSDGDGQRTCSNHLERKIARGREAISKIVCLTSNT